MIHLSKVSSFIAVAIVSLTVNTAMAKEDYKHIYEAEKYTLSMNVNNINSAYELAIKIKLNMNDDVSLFQAALPWGSRYSMIIIPVKLNSSADRLEERLFIDDPSPTILTLKANELLSGKILLTERFPDIYEVTKSTDVIVFWTYQLLQTNGESLGRLGGWLIIPKRDN